MSQLNIFISSTCFDLSQIRQDLSAAISRLGHKPLMSESISFPINPSRSNEENCIATVRDEADIFVLIIGSRYGYKLDTGKSITNTEYLAAVEKGIPIYTFTLKQMMSIYPIWENNPDANFTSVVDDNKIFEFIKDVRYKSNRWNFPFENANDIIYTLQEQLSILFKQTLKTQHKYEMVGFPSIQQKVSASAYRYLVEKNESYELKFFMQCLLDSIEEQNHLKRDYEYAIITLSDKHLKATDEIIDYIQLMLGKLRNIIDSLTRLVNDAFPKYYGDPGCPSDIDGLFYVAQTYAKLYASLLTCAIEARSIIVPEEFDRVMELLSIIPSESIHEIESFPKDVFEQIERAEKQFANSAEQMKISLTLTITFDELTSNKMFEELHKVISLG